MKKAFNLFSASLSKVFNDFVPFGHQVHRTFFTLAVLCAVAMMAGCKGGGMSAELDDRTATEADSLSQKEMLITPPGYFDKYSIPSEGPIDTMGLDTMIFTFCEVDAEFPGSEDSLNAFLHRNIRYPKDAKDKKIEGTVYVSFVVERDGDITDAKVVRDIGYGCGEEALRVLNTMPKWKPATQHGYAVRQQNNLPIRFSLNKIK